MYSAENSLIINKLSYYKIAGTSRGTIGSDYSNSEDSDNQVIFNLKKKI